MKIKSNGGNYTFWLYWILALNSTKPFFPNGKLVGNKKTETVFQKTSNNNKQVSLKFSLQYSKLLYMESFGTYHLLSYTSMLF